MDQLKSKRTQVKTKLTKFKTFVDSYKDEGIQQLKLRLEKAETLLETFDSIQSEIELIEEAEESHRTPFETTYYDVVAKAREIILNLEQETLNSTFNGQWNATAQLSAQAIQQNQNTVKVKLPAINLPTFGGNYGDWLMFSDSFLSIIHNNADLTDIQKFQYLRGALSNDAKQVIQSLETTEANYNEAWNLLKGRYENKQLIINTHLKQLFELTIITKESHTTLRTFIDSIRTNVSALKALKEPVAEWDTILIYLFCSKLDWRTRQLWQEKLASSEKAEKPTLNKFLDFLSSRCQSLEMAERTGKSDGQSKPTWKKTSLAATVPNQIKCEYCKKQHNLFRCEEFLKLSPAKRFEEVKKLQLCINCFKPGHFGRECNSSTCRKCKRRHNTLLHEEREANENKIETKDDKSEIQQESLSATALTSHTGQQNNNYVFLPTAIIMVTDKQGNKHPVRALLDSGSQSNFVTRKLIKKLNLTSNKINISIYGINQNVSNISEQIYLKINSNYTNFGTTIDCLVLDKITENLPQVLINKHEFNLPNNIRLADEQFDSPAPIDLLIGSEIFWKILCAGQIRLATNQPILQKTLFGWILAGAVSGINTHTRSSCLAINKTLQNQIEQFWKQEEVHEERKWTREEEQCEEHFVNTTTRDEEGRFIVSLPRKQSVELGNSFEGTLSRFRSLEKRLAQDENLKEDYNKFMKLYEELGHMTKVTEQQDGDINFYLPHHPVVKQESLTTKLRVVFDGSHKTTTNHSLNDSLLVGPVVQEELFNIILRFRTHQYVITADIAMMYRQILVKNEDRSLQKIIWRENFNEPLQIYTLNTVTYGTSSAPFLATRCLKQLAIEDGNQYPLAKEVMQTDFYMDDILTGTSTREEAVKLQKQLHNLLEKGKFQLRKWRANHNDILSHLTEENRANELFVLNQDEQIKTLGLYWNSHTDLISYIVNVKNHDRITKRTILSNIVQIYDPLGLIGPVMVKAKIIMQKIWQLGIDWDEALPQELYTDWRNYSETLKKINDLRIPRNVNPGNQEVYVDIHGFCDASEAAFGACVYVSSRNEQGTRNNQLLCSKSRVAPLKTISVPRLELCAATLLARLIVVVRQSLKQKINNIHLWSDSTIVLSWLKTTPTLLKTFVANRVGEIQKLTSDCTWYHVRSADNPADIISRGESAKQLVKNQLWWNGPDWIISDKWPEQPSLNETTTLEMKKITTLVTLKKDFNILTRYSSWVKLQRVIGYCRRFIYNLKNKTSQKTGELDINELNAATKTIIRLVQEECFSKELRNLEQGKSVNSKSKLLNLNPYVDDDNLIRVGGRLNHANITHDHKHPVVLPARHYIVNLILKHEHKKAHHCGPEQLLSIVRTKFWPISGRNSAKYIVRNCYQCFRFKPKNTEYIMGNLPSSRTCGVNRPFTICGVDYAGPIQLKEHKRRGRKPITKGYLAIFVCFSTKAVHIEVVSDLTTEAFLAALRRFTARRGLCSKIYSDNATNFVGANQRLKEIYKFLEQEESIIKEELSKRQIEWHFNPPRAPHFGGLYEAAVKSVKQHFYKVTQNLILTFEECYTLLTEIESILNSRPLTPLSNNPKDLNPLTPSHFLIGDALLEPVEKIHPHAPVNHLTRWQHLQFVKQHFWQRWYKEYLHHLQQRSKWQKPGSNVSVGSLVVLVEDNSPPLRWPMGRIIEVYPGADGVVRVVLVRTSQGVYKRPVKRVCVLPSE